MTELNESSAKYVATISDREGDYVIEVITGHKHISAAKLMPVLKAFDCVSTQGDYHSMARLLTLDSGFSAGIGKATITYKGPEEKGKPDQELRKAVGSLLTKHEGGTMEQMLNALANLKKVYTGKK